MPQPTEEVLEQRTLHTKAYSRFMMNVRKNTVAAFMDSKRAHEEAMHALAIASPVLAERAMRPLAERQVLWRTPTLTPPKAGYTPPKAMIN